MYVGVGSGNPVKRRAVEAALDRTTDGSGPSGSEELPFRDMTTVSVPVPSGVSEQPTGHGETIRGAERRAEAVLTGAFDPEDLAAADDLDAAGEGFSGEGAGEAFDSSGTEAGRPFHSAGLVAGGAFHLAVGIEGGVAEFPGADELYLIMWAAVTDGERWGRGAGPSFALPAHVAERVRAGEELGPVMDDVLGTENVAEKQGAAGALSGGRVDREGALVSAVGAALGPFVTTHYADR